MAAAERIFGLLPDDQGGEMRLQFEANATLDAQFANALDRLQPFLNNYHTKGESRRSHGVHAGQVRERMSPIGAASKSLEEYVHGLLVEAVRRGYVMERKN